MAHVSALVNSKRPATEQASASGTRRLLSAGTGYTSPSLSGSVCPMVAQNGCSEWLLRSRNAAHRPCAKTERLALPGINPGTRCRAPCLVSCSSTETKTSQPMTRFPGAFRTCGEKATAGASANTLPRVHGRSCPASRLPARTCSKSSGKANLNRDSKPLYVS